MHPNAPPESIEKSPRTKRGVRLVSASRAKSCRFNQNQLTRIKK
nr:MAG TPA: hypothetical protein [Caudoviricetes sp.]